MNLAFTKMHACGNDFIVIDDRAGRLAGAEVQLARRLCRRRLAIGADGLLLLRASPAPGRFGMVFVNADGLIGEMCGNGARCLAAYLRRAGLAGTELRLDTPAGTVPVRFHGESIVLELPPTGALHTGIAIAWQGHDWLFDQIDIGVPHVVCFVADRAALRQVPVDTLGRHVRHHERFAPRGCNVNFAALEDGRLHLRTYERGVEAETLGCGTGATAAALAAQRRFGLPAAVEVVTSSGEPVRIDCTPGGPLRLAGGAHFVADGRVDASLLQGLELPA